MQVSKTYKVVIIDEILVSHTGLCFLINKLQDFRVVDYQNIYANDRPNINTFDALLYSTRSVDTEVVHKINRIRAKMHNLPIIVLAPGASTREQFELINLGINGLIIQEATIEALKESMLCAVHHGFYFPVPLMSTLKDNSNRPYNRHLVKAAFSNMQQEILQLLASGLTTPMVAEKLFKSVRTIEWHKEQMMKAISVGSTSQLLLFALEYGIIDSPFGIGGRSQTTTEVQEEAQLYLRVE